MIRKKMFGTQKWKIFGQSFGGLISFRYLELFPESVESAHIHGFGFSLDPSLMLDLRERRISEITPEFLKYKNSKVSSMSIGQIIDRIKNSSPEAKQLFNSVCVETPGALMEKLCGEDIFSGLYMMSGFKNTWGTAQNYLYKMLLLIESGKKAELDAYFKRFVSIYLLRFPNLNQSAALHAITYNELFPGHLLSDGCTGFWKENDLISECRFNKNFMTRLSERPTFQSRPVDLNVVKDNIKKVNVPIFYYAGMYDSFLPIELLRDTADYLDIKSSLHVFGKSGHEGFYTEKLVIENLLK